MKPTKPKTVFGRFAKATARLSGKPIAFIFAFAIIIVWLVTGPIFDFNNTWQLVINTGTTIITFLMVFLIQSTQNRDTEAIQVKLDELLRTAKGAHNSLLDLEELEEHELDEIRREYLDIAELAREKLRNNEDDTDIPELKNN
jgi:low affinity Fe/Cu permease